MFLMSSCHWVLPKDAPARLINFHEQVEADAWGYVHQLRAIENSSLSLLASSPPSGFLRQGQFIGYKENEDFLSKKIQNDQQLKLVCTLDPSQSIQMGLDQLKSCRAKGAIGVKFYHLHAGINKKDFSNKKIWSDAEMVQILQALEKQKLILFLFTNNFVKQASFFQKVAQFPQLAVLCSNFCFVEGQLDELDQLLQKTPNLYIGYSFLFPKIFFNFLKSFEIERIKRFFQRHQNRIVYESSFLLSENGLINKRYMHWSFKNRYRFLKDKVFTFFSPPIINQARNMPGLELSSEIIDKIYYSNAKKLLDGLSNTR